MNYKKGNIVWAIKENQIVEVVGEKRMTDNGEKYGVYNKELDLVFCSEDELHPISKDMFEALGYRKYSIETSGLIIGWQANPKDYKVACHEYRNIQFYTDKTWNIFADGITQSLVFSKPTIDEFLAIQQEMRQLGWIE